MLSLRARIFTFVLNNRHLLRFQLRRRTGVDENTSIEQLRRESERTDGLFGRLPAGFTIEPITIGNMNAERMTPPDARDDCEILYFHGGGYVLGNARSHRPIVAKFVRQTGIPTLTFDYRIAPEHPFPAAVDDAVAAYTWLLEHGGVPEKIAFIGDSAGGGLCLALLMAIKEHRLPMPAAVAAMSPWTDLANSGESFITNAKTDTLCWTGAQEIFSRHYLNGADPYNPLASPLYGDMDGLPPIRLYVGGTELLRDDATRFVQKAKEAGGDAEVTVGHGLFHCYPVCAPMFPEATEALHEICVFIGERLQ